MRGWEVDSQAVWARGVDGWVKTDGGGEVETRGRGRGT